MIDHRVKSTSSKAAPKRKSKRKSNLKRSSSRRLSASILPQPALRRNGRRNGYHRKDSICILTEQMSFSSSESSSDIIYSDKQQGVFSFYQRGDGSAKDQDGIPKRYLKMAKRDRTAALKAVQRTLKWREERGINDMLKEPHVNFDIIKAVIPHFYLGRDIQGHVVHVIQPARLNAKQLNANGLTYDDVMRHAIYINEYLWQIVEAENANALTTTIIDAGGLHLRDLTRKQDQVQCLRKMAAACSNHYPTRGHKTVVVNAPNWFNLLWKLVKPDAREGTVDMIEICSRGKKQDETLLQLLGEETSSSLPDFCWSKHKRGSNSAVTSTAQLQMEKELRDFVMSRIEASGKTMAPVLP